MSGHLKSGVLSLVMQAEEEKKGGARIPLYRQISDTLLAGIRDGKFPVGSFLPGEMDLISRFDASRHTIREALRVLEDMGMVARQRGRGTVVLSTMLPQRLFKWSVRRLNCLVIRIPAYSDSFPTSGSLPISH
jgi:DNA-binding transcriptional regulator YhcF (GntR family)